VSLHAEGVPSTINNQHQQVNINSGDLGIFLLEQQPMQRCINQGRRLSRGLLVQELPA